MTSVHISYMNKNVGGLVSQINDAEHYAQTILMFERLPTIKITREPVCLDYPLSQIKA